MRLRVVELQERQISPGDRLADLRAERLAQHLAVDAVAGAIRDECDVAVFFTEDTDLLPALELVAEVKGRGSVEVAA